MATQFSGGTYVSTTFTGAVRSDIQSNLITQLVTAGWTNVAQATSQGPGNVGTVTITVATPGVVTLAAHGFLGNERVILQVSAGGALPTGLSVNTVYFVKYVDANTFNLAATSGGANINTTGSTSGTITLNTQSILLQSATQTNVTNPIRVRLKDNLGNCIQISIENQAGSVVGTNNTTNGGNLLPAAAKTFRVLATKYHFMCFTPGVSAAREFVMAGMIFVPTFLTGITDVGYVYGNANSDTDSTFKGGFRSDTAFHGSNANGGGNAQVIWNSSLLEQNAANWLGAGTGLPATNFSMSPVASPKSYRWANDDINTSDVLLGWGLTLASDENKLKGQFFDLIYIADAFTIDATDTFNTHNWYNLTNNNAGSSTTVPRGGMWFATS